MITLNDAIKILDSEETEPVNNVFETQKNFLFSYGDINDTAYYRVNKGTGKLDVFLPQDDFNEYNSMVFIKKMR